MIVDATSQDFRLGLKEIRSFRGIVASTHSIRVIGDNTCQRLIFIYNNSSRCLIADKLCTLIKKVRECSLPLTLDNSSISHLLHHNLVPLPSTVFRQIKVISVGCSATLSQKNDAIELDVELDFPYLNGRSRQNNAANTGTLFELLVQSVERAVQHVSPVLMLSSGKDSVSLALALAELGANHVPCVTYANTACEEEDTFAAPLAQRLGLRHETMTPPSDEKQVRNILEAFFEASPIPCCDPAQIAYVFALAIAGAKDCLVLDGMGNDFYMGYMPNRKQRLKYSSPIGNLPNMGKMRRFLPRGHLDKLFRSDAEYTIMNGICFRPFETKCFFAGSVDTPQFWLEITRSLRHLDDFDFLTSLKTAHYSIQSANLKGQLAARATRNEICYPWADSDLIEYVFNLEEPYRFDRNKFKNKILLRTFLLEKLGYDDKTRINRGFNFARERFLIDNWKFAEDEILSCQLWSNDVSKAVARIKKDKIRNQNSLPLLNMFMISGWHNHSRYL